MCQQTLHPDLPTGGIPLLTHTHLRQCMCRSAAREVAESAGSYLQLTLERAVQPAIILAHTIIDTADWPTMQAVWAQKSQEWWPTGVQVRAHVFPPTQLPYSRTAKQCIHGPMGWVGVGGGWCRGAWARGAGGPGRVCTASLCHKRGRRHTVDNVMQYRNAIHKWANGSG